MLIEADRALIFLVDLQTRLAPAIHEGAAAIRRNRLLLALARRLGMPVFISEHYVSGLGPTLPEIRSEAVDAQIFPKITFDATRAEGVLPALAASGRRQILLTGMEAHVCVLQTAAGLQRAGYTVFLVTDAVGSRDPEDHRLALQRLAQAGIILVRSEMVCFECLGQGGTEDFRALLPLIR